MIYKGFRSQKIGRNVHFKKVVINIRNPDRLDDFYSQLCEIHKKSFPDWRFGQLCSNFFGWLASEKKMDLFFPEESQMLTYLREFCGEENKEYDK